MKRKRLTEVLDTYIDTYINNIAFELEKTHSHRFEDFGFPLFGETSKQYHEQVYFQSYLESYTRQMINGILKELFDYEVVDKIIWPEFSSINQYIGYTNSECEHIFGFEFVDHDTKTGYRYSSFYNDEIDALLSKGDVEGIVLVKWGNKDEIIGIEYADSRVKVILLWDLFNEMFIDLDKEEVTNMYDMFIDRVTKAVAQANSMISLTTVPGFTPSYLYKKRDEVIADFRKEVKNLSCFSVNMDDYKFVETNSKRLVNVYGLSQYFLENKFENAFIGTSDFAKSYLTSDYLFHYFKKNKIFDYTPIVSGYIKSVEQLLHVICERYFLIRNKSRDFSLYSLKKYTEHIKWKKFLRKELEPASNIIIDCLDCYRKETRNNLFHTDYFNDWNRVEQIRVNTIFIYVMLLGAVNSNILADHLTVLGIVSREYDQLFNVFDEQKDALFSFILDGKEYLEMRMEHRYKGLVFNENGLITNTIVFKKYDFDKEEVIEISRANMPTRVWITDSVGKSKKVIWPID